MFFSLFYEDLYGQAEPFHSPWCKTAAESLVDHSLYDTVLMGGTYQTQRLAIRLPYDRALKIKGEAI